MESTVLVGTLISVPVPVLEYKSMGGNLAYAWNAWNAMERSKAVQKIFF